MSVPRTVDGVARRRAISDTVWKIASEEGLSAVTFRRIAAELGTSTTVITHTYRNRDSMLDDVFRMRVQQYIEDLRRHAAGTGPAQERLRGVLLVSSPLTDSDLRDARVWLVAVSLPETRPRWIRHFADYNRTFYELVTGLLQQLDADPELLHPLVALVWGVNAAAVEDPLRWSGARVRWTIDTTLAALGLCPRPPIAPAAAAGAASAADRPETRVT